MNLGRRIRHLQRYREILHAFARNGFGYFVNELGLVKLIPHWRSVENPDHTAARTTGERIRSFLQELGPTFVKLGQIASTRHDLLPKDIVQELQMLQDKVPPIPFTVVKQIIEEELGVPLSSVFLEFPEEPVAAASIGQVHHARLLSGVEVAVKVQRPGIRKTVETDLEILLDLARLAEHRLHWAKQYHAPDLVEELSISLKAELDYTLEGRSAERIAAQFKDNPQVRVPAIYWDLTSERVLTMEFLEGIPLYDQQRLLEHGYKLKDIAQGVASVILEQVFISGLFHADPHPGNVLVMDLPEKEPSRQASAANNTKPVIGLLDFGMTGRLTPGMKGHFASLVIALRRQSTDGVIKAIDEMGLIPEDTNWGKLRHDVDKLREKYYQVPFSEVSLGDSVMDLFDVSYRHQIRLPSDFMLLGKALLTLEGVITALDPEFSIVSVAEPFGRRLLLERLQPSRLAETAAGYAIEYASLLGELPARLRNLGRMLKRGKLPLELSVPDVDRVMQRLDRISGRLSFSIVLLSFSIIMAGLIIGSSLGREPGLLTRIPALEIGFGIAAAMFIYMLVSIFRSGKK